MTSPTEPRIPLPPPARRIYCNRTLNLRSIAAVGFDMDYTLIHYRTEEWERCAYGHVQQRLLALGWPVESLRFDPELVRLGLILDLDLGNVVKADRFGYVRRAAHGTRMLEFEEQRATYSRLLVGLAEPRWVFMNTLFALSEACLYAQLVDLKDQGRLPGVHSYAEVYRLVKSHLDEAHMEGRLKAAIIADPDRFVDRDPELLPTLLDLRRAGKKLLLITNSEWSYTGAMMDYAFAGALPAGSRWRDLFDLVVVGARKPQFFGGSNPVLEVVEDSGLLRPFHGPLRAGGAYLGGNSRKVEELLGCKPEEILYVGDHIFADVNVTKSLLRWRTALVVRELEEELAVVADFAPRQGELSRLMEHKERLEHEYSTLRLRLLRLEGHDGGRTGHERDALRERLQVLRTEAMSHDHRIAPVAKAAGELGNARWGLLMRTGGDKSHLARQIEKYADVYTSRVSNFGLHTPFAYLRAPRGSLPHDPMV